MIGIARVHVVTIAMGNATMSFLFLLLDHMRRGQQYTIRKMLPCEGNAGLSSY